MDDEKLLRFDALSALVTGSTSGIGLAIADALEARGARVVRHGLATDAGTATVLRQDLAAPDSGRLLAAAALATGPIDIVVLSASLQIRKPWTEISAAELEKQFRVNIGATLELLQELVPPMQERGWGRVLTIGSVQQRRPHRDMTAYAASKAAQLNLVTNLAGQLASSGVTVNNLAPGVIETPRNSEALASEEYRGQTVGKIPMGRIGGTEDCVPPALLLCSPAGGYITGQDILVDGGFTL